jgi:hypothetical protein
MEIMLQPIIMVLGGSGDNYSNSTNNFCDALVKHWNYTVLNSKLHQYVQISGKMVHILVHQLLTDLPIPLWISETQMQLWKLWTSVRVMDSLQKLSSVAQFIKIWVTLRSPLYPQPDTRVSYSVCGGSSCSQRRWWQCSNVIHCEINFHHRDLKHGPFRSVCGG